MTLFKCQLEEFGKEGLDLPLFKTWLDNNIGDFAWPSGALCEYFHDKADSAGRFDKFEPDYFGLLGIVNDPGRLQFFYEMYKMAEPLGIMVERCSPTISLLSHCTQDI